MSQEDTSLSKVYTLFRTLGLRHLCVVPRSHDVVGLIARADLLPDALEVRAMHATCCLLGACLVDIHEHDDMPELRCL